jgi:hypothetical protein
MSEKAAAGAGKDVLYIDVDDEITSIIDKVHASKQKIVALVLPKRATVLQSIVNMKLLKRSADGAHKNLVLITSEAGLLPLAGTVGLHVAKSLQTKPEIPDGPNGAEAKAEAIEEVLDQDTEDAADKPAKSEPKLDKNRAIGELAGAAAVEDQMEDSIDLNDEEDDAEADDDAPISMAAKPKKGKNKKLKIPNFNKFRMLLIVGGAGIAGLIVLLFVCLSVLPKATITVKTDSTAINSATVVALKIGDNVATDVKTGTVQAVSQQVQKTATQQVPATGQKNNGVKATGDVTLSLKDCSVDQVTIPAGTGVVSGGLTFITKIAATLNSVKVGGQCKNSSFPAASTASVGVIAQNGGASYNLAAATYSVSGYSSVTGSGTAMTGGTDDIIKIVTQGDIDGAKQKLSAADTAGIKQELKSGLTAKNLYVVDMSFNAGNPDVKTSVNAGDAADNVTVTQATTYTMLGTKEANLQQLIKDNIKGKIDLKKQKILDYGLKNAVFGLQSQNPDGATVTMQSTVVVGSELDVEAIKKQVAGKKAGDAQSIIKQNPGVTDVDVAYSPFWVSSIPKKTSKITVVVQKPKATSSSNNASNP